METLIKTTTKKAEKISQEFLMFDRLLERSQHIFQNSFERAFIEPKSFDLLCLLVSGFRYFNFDEDIIENFVLIYGSSMNDLLKSIRIFFNIHNESIPDNLYGVIKKMSRLLP